MAITEAFAGSHAVDTTEWSMPRNASYASGSTQTDDGVYQLFLDLTNAVAGNELQIRIYEKVQSAGTQRVVYQSNLVGPQSPAVWVSPSLVLLHGWDMTLDSIVGTATIEWSIRKVA